ncbi:AraC family transcriptional regulator [Burkholderia gladioli]|jgi:AraC-like DNA-binding protein|uniref:AraC family transcriptional regulator n=3 Tax=Burkholderiaceae TaxID=119060 RepID=A0A095YGN1_BURGA|nr:MULTISPECIES: AraC family transcriptional regulator [Burkholderia]AJW96160.1 helix-turn-helix domain protein [Burkholderia gladioli]ASD82952.1 AraC family transcriptional regulator [Burkholderia gladioli pv. gladioli]ATF89715.1 AraC family transcriptional regulator [Burkholderia gladioli pv. gladioli]AWY50388.1 AraC family transcriptional regulator [Burkholderia gladioli pv. gladioli]AYQ92653.1 AraC family transcriptional regulator [Burkholderia gladioli]
MTSPADSSSPLFDAIRPAPGSGDGLDAMLAHFAQLAPVFDALPDVAFFVKDVDGRYVLANRTLAQRCGFKEKRELYGKTTEEVFPRRFGRNYLEQDMATIHAGQQLTDQLELHLYPGRQPGWCLTTKEPLRDGLGRVVGLAGISRDLKANEGSHPAYSRLADVVQYIQEHYVQPLNLKHLAEMAGMSVAQLERYFHKVFHLTPRQVLLKTRLDAATALLVTHEKVTDVAALCGYTDHSAFSRQFKATVGVTPTEYRMTLQAERGA